MSQELGSTSQPDQARVLDQLVQASAQLVQADYCAFYACERDQRQPISIAQHTTLQDDGPYADQAQALARAAIDGAHAVLIPEQRARGLRSLLAVPVGGGERPYGALVAGALRPYAFDQADQILLSTLAEQAAIAIENARLYESTALRVRELTILNEIGRTIIASLDVDVTLKAIMRQVQESFDVESGSLLLVEDDRLVFQISFGPAGEQVKSLSLQVGQGIAGWVAETGTSVLVSDAKEDARHYAGVDKLTGYETRSLLCVPLKSAADHVIGVIEIMNPRDGSAFTDQDRKLLESVGTFAVVAIQNAQLFSATNAMTGNLGRLVAERTEALARANEQLTSERDRLNLLYLIVRELSGSLDPERALSRTLVLINRALRADEGYVLLQDIGRQYLVYRALFSETPPADGVAFPAPRMGDSIDHRSDTGLIGWLVSHQDSIRIADVSGAPHLHLVPNQDRWHRSLLAAPLLTGADIAGAIVFYHSAPNHFTVDHQRLFDAVAAQIAIAASNAEMFRLLREAADRLGIMLRSQQLEAAKSHAILEGVADGVMVTDAQGEVTLFNAAAERILQVHRADIIGHSSAEVSGIFGLAGTSWTHLTDLWGKSTLQADGRALYDERLELDGRSVSMRVAPVVRQGTFQGTVSVFRDITKEVELDRMKSEFVSSVSHELRTPMTSIKGYIDLLYSGMAGSVSEGQKRFLQIIKTNADRLTLLVNDLLDISRIETGRLKLTIESVDPSYIVDLVLSSHMPDAARRQQTLTSAIDEPLPHVRADPDRMTQVLTNLVSNAIQYTPAGGTITVSAAVKGDFLHLSVQDNGIGIKDEDKPKLFSRFFRADTPLVQARSGTGLGLAIVKSIVELQGGEIWFDSTFGTGSTFGFSLPLADQAGLDAARREFRMISYRQQDKRILLVESQVEIADAIAHRLRTQGGYLVHVERSGRDALRYLARTDPSSDLILLDLDLPEMEGMELLQHIVGHGSLAAIPVLALSLSHDVQGDRPSDTTAYVSRPVRAHRLLEAVNAVFAEKVEDLDRTAGSVMIAETDNQLAELFTMVLTQKGYTVDIQRDLSNLPSIACDVQPDMILLDVTQPDQAGFDVLRTLKERADTRKIPVLVVTSTALDMQAQRQQDLDVNAFEFVDGPVEVQDLFAEIKHVLDETDTQNDAS
ncbi:MAG: GAF domain-containing protein [Anaerolineae bacterium]|nr:GAF domain-containing protein [Anaerolineae bacterium]